MRPYVIQVTSAIAFILAIFQLYLGLNMESFGIGGLHLHITVALILLGLFHIPFLRGEGLHKKVYLGLIILTGLQGLLGLYMAFIQHILFIKNIHHGFGWLILFGSLVGLISILLKK